MVKKILAAVVVVLLAVSVSHAGIISNVKSKAKSTASSVKNTASNVASKVTNTPSGQVVSAGSAQHTGSGTPPKKAGTTTQATNNNQAADGSLGKIFGN